MLSSSSSSIIDKRPPWLRTIQPFVVGGCAGCVATCCVQPIDMVKVRIQLVGESTAGTTMSGSSKNPFRVAQQIIQNEGITSLYKGLDAGLIRQVTYTTSRMGLFRVLSDYLKRPEETRLPLYKKAAAGLLAGGAASLIGNPADLSLIRLQSDATLPIDQRRNYTSVLNALSRTIREEGALALWRGSTPTVLRAMALNMGMLASYDQTKEMLTSRMGSGWGATLAASAVSGFFAVTFSLPFDFIKTRIQRMKVDPVTGTMPYKSFGDCAMKVLKREGPLAFYAGYPTYYVRIAPHAMITLIVVDIIDKKLRSNFS